jgi:hypothetical protein
MWIEIATIWMLENDKIEVSKFYSEESHDTRVILSG